MKWFKRHMDDKNTQASAESAEFDENNTATSSPEDSSGDDGHSSAANAARGNAPESGSADDSDPEGKKIVELSAQVADLKDKYIRSLAEFENYKKRTIKERSELVKYQGERIFSDILEVVDNFDLAMPHASGDPEKFATGMKLIHKLFLDVLGRWDVRSESALGQPFDPYRHKALSQMPVDTREDGSPKPGTVVNELKKAFFYKDKLLRPADVVIAVAAPDAQEQNEEDTTDEE